MPILSWSNRSDDALRSTAVPYRLLEPVASLHYGEPDSPNMLIEGDNLDALKALLPYYAGEVKCIFIDPPYNTQSAFKHYDDNLEHSKWLSMMYPRLELLRDLLCESGSIWVTIDDNEVHYLKVIMDEVFGRKNFVANIIWEKRTSRENRRVMSFKHDHVLCYAKEKPKFEATRNALPLNDVVLGRYKNPDGDPRGAWQSVSANAQAGHATKSQFYPLTLPSGRVIEPPKGRCWLYTEDRLKEEIAAGNIWFGAKGNNAPRVKKFLDSGEKGGLTPETIWYAREVSTNDAAKKDLLRLLPDAAVFDTPKPEALIQRIIQIATNPGDVVLDSFLGSGTTAAVAQKMGRRWVGVEFGDHVRTHCRTRLAKVVDGDQGGCSVSVKWSGGGGFRFYKLGSAVFDEAGQVRADIKFEHLAAHIWFAETGVARSSRAAKDVFLGVHAGVGYYLLFNGILGDENPNGGNVLTRRLLRGLPKHAGPKVIYGEACMLSPEQLGELDISFKQTPYDIKAR